MKISISHTTTYSYEAPVNYALQQVRLTPSTSSQQTVLNWQVDVEGGEAELSFVDEHQNQTLLVKADEGIQQLRVTASGDVDTHNSDGVLGQVYGRVPLWLFKNPTDRTQAGAAIKKLSKVIGKSDSLLNDLHVLSSTILEAVPYEAGKTFADTTAEEAFMAGSGVCQDHAQIFLSAVRCAHVPARYVSGYLMMNDRIDQDASHAWVEAHIEGLGWVGFDVSNRISPDERYIRLAIGMDSQQAAPITGMRQGGANESMVVSLQVQQ